MKPLILTDLLRNPYRTLGLLADATESQVDAAARALRLYDDPAHIPPTPNDAPFLGPVRRARQDIESAIARLADPLARVEERLWWFTATPAESKIPPLPTAPAAVRHDAALLQLHRVLLTDADDSSLPRWKSLIAQLEKLSADDDYLTWLLDAESNGDFEKRASMEEVAAAQQTMPHRLKLALAAAADGALTSGNISSAGQAAELLQSNNPAAPANNSPAAQPANPADKILDQLEDKLLQRCEQFKEVIRKPWKDRQANMLRSACHRVMNKLDSDIKPLLGEITALSAGDPERPLRANQEVAALIAFAVDGYEALYDFISSERTLTLALTYAKNTLLEPRITERLAVATAAAERQRRGVPARHREHGLKNEQQT